MCSVQELHLYLFSSSDRVILASFTSLTVSLHSSTNLSTNFFLHLQFSWSNYSATSHDLSHSHSQLLGFKIKSFITHAFINQFFAFTPTFIIIPMLFIITNACIQSIFRLFMPFCVSCFISSLRQTEYFNIQVLQHQEHKFQHMGH